jgi:hypothetical protein
MTNDATLDLKVKIVSTKPSDHKWFGKHDLLTVELTEAAGTLPAGLRFTLRRPHDGSADLRSDERKAKVTKRGALPMETPTVKMRREQLIALADARGIDVPGNASKEKIVSLLTEKS